MIMKTGPSTRRRLLRGGLILLLLAGPARGTAPQKSLLLATTTSVDATGLLNVVADDFLAATGISLRWIAVGTGAALKQARDGNVDAVIVHAKPLEDAFIAEGFGVNRRVVARNYFILAGPPSDPAGLAGAPDVRTALLKLKAAAAPFVSRGDKSGTHIRELELWAAAGGPPAREYYETGQGMPQTLQVAAEKRAYTLTDTATFQTLAGSLDLRPVFENAPELENVYAVIAVHPARVPTAKYAEAMSFIAYLTSPRGQAAIGAVTGKSGRPLFEPLAAEPGIDFRK